MLLKIYLSIFIFIFFNGCNEDITHNGVSYNSIKSPYTGRIWLDRNLGAKNICANFNDSSCFGDYYQWGRKTDGHEKFNHIVLIDNEIDLKSSKILLGNKNQDYDWSANNDQNGKKRQAYWNDSSANAICPKGYRVPTEKELSDETIFAQLKVTNSQTAYNNFLKLPTAGYRTTTESFSLGIKNFASYWTLSTNTLTTSRAFIFDPDSASWMNSFRSNSYSIRCIKN